MTATDTLWQVPGILYRGQTIANAALSAAILRAAYYVFGWSGGKPPRAAQQELRRRVTHLMDADWENARLGKYPMRLLFESPVAKYGKHFPELVREGPRIARRRRRSQYDAIPHDVDRSRYPRYYLRTFHWQTDGWFSARSAEIYDASVELLFGGTAGTMRRMVIPPILDAIADVETPKILDVACGTGPMLSLLCTVRPDAVLTGIDLSEAYLEHARKLRGDGPRLTWGNAESMHFADASFDAITCVFLFHELPRAARRNVMKEMARVVKPGGSIVILDSAQFVESRAIEFFLTRFPEVYHEPYYRDYLKDDLESIVTEAGLELVDSAPYAVSKLVCARRPAIKGDSFRAE